MCNTGTHGFQATTGFSRAMSLATEVLFTFQSLGFRVSGLGVEKNRV